MTYRLGVDVGGTFTDILLIDEASGATYRAKTASTPDDQSVGVLRGIERARAQAGVPVSEIGEVFHGTTVATNAILASSLLSQGIDTVVLVGVSTSGCVRATAVDAIQLGFVPLVVRDAVGDPTEQTQESNLYDLQAKYAEVVSEADAVAYLAAAR